MSGPSPPRTLGGAFGYARLPSAADGEARGVAWDVKADARRASLHGPLRPPHGARGGPGSRDLEGVLRPPAITTTPPSHADSLLLDAVPTRVPRRGSTIVTPQWSSSPPQRRGSAVIDSARRSSAVGMPRTTATPGVPTPAIPRMGSTGSHGTHSTATTAAAHPEAADPLSLSMHAPRPRSGKKKSALRTSGQAVAGHQKSLKSVSFPTGGLEDLDGESGWDAQHALHALAMAIDQDGHEGGDGSAGRRGAMMEMTDSSSAASIEESASGQSTRRGESGADSPSRIAPTITDDVSNAPSDASDATLDPIVEDWPAWRNAIRYVVVTNPWFDRGWFFMILLNCVVLAAEDPTDRACLSHRCKITNAIGHVFTCLFAVEMALKIAALGFRKRRGAYLNDNWNRLDFFIVLTGFLTIFLEIFVSGNSALSAFRAFRILRPVRAVQAFAVARTLVQSILSSIPHLLDVFILYFFFVLTMSILAMQFWKGLLSYRCARLDNPPLNMTVVLPFDEEPDGRICKHTSWGLSHYVGGGYICPWGYECTNTGQNPEHGDLSFDHIGLTMLTVYTALTLEGWTDTAAITIDAMNKLVVFYWVFVILFGSFFLLNVTIVIITEAFEKKRHEQTMAAFYSIDKDGTGELDREEVRMLLNRKYGRDVTEEELDDAFDEMDQDGGGTISLDEFLSYTSSHASLAARRKSTITGVGSDLKRLLVKLPGASIVGNIWLTVGALFTPRTETTPMQRWFYQLVCDGPTRNDMRFANKAFRRFIYGVIVINTGVLAVDHYIPDPSGTFNLEAFVDWCHFGFTIIFLVEAGAKLYGLGIKLYFDDRFNTADFWILLACVIHVVLVLADARVPVFGSAAVLRIVKVAVAFKSLQKWIQIVVSSVSGAAILTCLLGLVIFIVALTGMQFFGGRFCFLDDAWDPGRWWVTPEMRVEGTQCGGLPRANYDNLGDAFLTSFQILTGENWNTVMYAGMRARGGWVCLYFVVYYAIGNYLLLKLFIAVLLNNRDLKEVNETADPAPPSIEKKKKSSDGKSKKRSEAAQVKHSTEFTYTGVVAPYMKRENACIYLTSEGRPKYICFRIAESPIFEALILLAVAASAVLSAMYSPFYPPDHPMVIQLEEYHFWILWVFVAELVVKSFGYGFVLHRTSYLRRDGWNILDFSIVVVSLIALAIPGGERIGIVQFVRTLRPLRLIKKSNGMKIVVSALFSSLRPLANVMAITMLTWLIFGIVGVQIFKGSFYRCTRHDFGDVELAYPNITSKDLCLNNCPYPDNSCRWMTFSSNFDSLPNAMVTLLEMSSLEGWVDVMHLGMDFVGPDKSPQLNNNKFWAIYFLVFVVFGSFFIINLFIGVLIDTYYLEKERVSNSETGAMFLNDSQRAWVNEYRKMIDAVRSEDSMRSLVKRKSLSFTVSPGFDAVVLVTIVLNVFVMLLTREECDGCAYNRTLDVLNIVFAGLFLVEALLKILALGFRNYWSFAWNRFDFFIVVVSTLGVALHIVLSQAEAVSVFRILRLARLLKIERAKGIHRILKTLFISAPSLFNVAGVFFLLLYVYALLGVRLFARVRLGEYLNVWYNFRTFDASLLLLVRMATGEGWQGVSADTRVTAPDCDPHLDECGFPVLAPLYFLSYTLVGMYVLLNLFIAIIMDNFTESGQSESQGVTTDYIDLMQAAWDLRAREIDGEKVMTQPEFIDFVREIGPPLGPPHNATNRKVHYFIVSLDLEVTDQYIRKEEAFLKLFKKNFGEDLPPEMEDRLNRELCASLSLHRPKTVINRRKSLSQHVAMTRVQAMIKSWLARRRVQAIRERRGNRLELNPSYVPQMVPSKLAEVRIVFPEGGAWISNPNYKMLDTELPNVPSLKDLADLLRIYQRHWWALTPEQQAFYQQHYERTFELENQINSALQLQPKTADDEDAPVRFRFAM